MGELTAEHYIKTTKVENRPTHLTLPCKALKLAILQSEIAILDNPVARWHLSNVLLEMDEKSLLMPAKANRDRNKKIDFVSATAMALERSADAKNRIFNGKIWGIE